MALYPLKFEPIYMPKVWGGRTLNSVLGRQLPGDEPIGESWELADLAGTSAGGGGGAAARSIIANGPLAGQTLHALIQQFGSELMGNLQTTDVGGFPLLVKYLDANDNLSVQVHPSPAYAETHADAHLKSECWYVINARPGAKIYRGLQPGVDRDQFAKAIENNTVESLMIAESVSVGDMFYLPSGTCHALGAGILCAEVQTPSDTTYRVYDWGRTGRELHIEQALACIEFGPAQVDGYEPNTVISNDQLVSTALVRCEYFNVDRHQPAADFSYQPGHIDPVVLMITSGCGVIRCRDSDCDQTTFKAGDTILLPAKLQAAEICFDTDCDYLEVTFPQARADTIA